MPTLRSGWSYPHRYGHEEAFMTVGARTDDTPLHEYEITQLPVFVTAIETKGYKLNGVVAALKQR